MCVNMLIHEHMWRSEDNLRFFFFFVFETGCLSWPRIPFSGQAGWPEKSQDPLVVSSPALAL